MLPESYRSEYTGALNNTNNMQNLKMTFTLPEKIPAVSQFTNKDNAKHRDSSAFQRQNLEGVNKEESNKFLSGGYALKNRTMIGGTTTKKIPIVELHTAGGSGGVDLGHVIDPSLLGGD